MTFFNTFIPLSEYTKSDIANIFESDIVYSDNNLHRICRDPNPSEIYSNLFLGELYHCSDKTFLREKNISNILTIHEYPCELGKDPNFSYIKFKHISINDRPNIIIKQYFEECNEFIKSAHDKKENVYVHCEMGISRSVSIVIAYMMYSKNISVNDAIDYVRSKRSQIDPNFGFVCQLFQYEKELKILNKQKEIKKEI